MMQNGTISCEHDSRVPVCLVRKKLEVLGKIKGAILCGVCMLCMCGFPFGFSGFLPKSCRLGQLSVLPCRKVKMVAL